MLRAPKSADGGIGMSFRSASDFASLFCAPSRSMTSQCARLKPALFPISHVSVSGSGLRGCSRTNVSYVSFTSGHHAVLCAGVRLRVIVDRHAAALHVLDVRIDDAGRIQRIASAVHGEDRLVAQVVREDQPIVDVAQREHHPVAVERQDARERRRLAHRHVVGAGAAVRHAGEDDAVFVDVVEALHAVDDRGEIEHLIVAPPRRLGPRVGDNVDLLGAGERTDGAVADRRIRRASADAAVQLDADLIAADGIVLLRHVHGVDVLDAIRCAILQAHDAGLPRGVGAAALQASIGLVEIHAGAHDRIDELRGVFG